MTTEAKRAANRANAQKSTGPRSSEGKARASQNARRHGLGSPVAADPLARIWIASLATALAGEGASPALQAQAAVVAEAQADLQRARAARTHLQGQLTAALEGNSPPPPEWDEAIEVDEPSLITPRMILQGKFESLFTMSRLRAHSRAVLRHDERMARARKKRARDWLAALIKNLARLDRYERRALSRRRTAEKHLDELRIAEARPDT